MKRTIKTPTGDIVLDLPDGSTTSDFERVASGMGYNLDGTPIVQPDAYAE